MTTRQIIATAVVTSLVGTLPTWAEEVRYYEQDGVTYRESRQIVEKRVPEVRYEERSQTIYRDQCVTEMKDTVRTTWVPVTEYQVQERLVGRWNPLARPYFEYRSVPVTRWEPRSEAVQVPMARRKLLPEVQTVRTPVTHWRTVQEEVIRRVALSATPNTSTLAASPSPATLAGPLVPVEIPEAARRSQIGGLAELDSDPPRQGTGTASRNDANRLRR